MRQLETCDFQCKLLIIITLINLNKNAVCESWRLMVLKMQVINYNHIHNPEQKRCVRQLETRGFKCKLLIIIILTTLKENAVCESWRLGFKCKLLIIITLINLNKNAVCDD